MSAKRKAAAAALDGASDAKKRKVEADEETAEKTTEVGLKFLEQLKSSRDKRQRLIATGFIDLPDQKKNPQYYAATPLPLSISIIEGKLRRKEYPKITPLESDLKRLIANAKSFYARSSDEFSDAEKVRKMVTSHMAKLNPAYHDGSGYQSFPTPIPETESSVDEEEGEEDEEDEEIDQDAEGETDPEEEEEEVVISKPTLTLHLSVKNKDKDKEKAADRRASSTPAIQLSADDTEGFEGLTFQKAQEKLVGELLQLKNDEEQLIAGPFFNLPSRELRDYYRVIKQPQSIKGLQKMVRGIRGREKPTGVSFMKSWHEFEEEVTKIWNNARIYNEDGSEIFELASEIEAHFKNRFAEAKKHVAEPAQPKVKLRMSAKSPEPAPKITLRIGHKAGTENDSGVSVDKEALQRQKDLVAAGVNEQNKAETNGSVSRPPSRNPLASSGSGPNGLPTLNSLSQDRRSASINPSPTAVNGVKAETQNGLSPVLGSAQSRPASGDGTTTEAKQSPIPPSIEMPPPAIITPKLPSGSPHPPATTQTIPPPPPTPQPPPPVNPLDSRWRPQGKGIADALITNLSISTHPGLKIDNHFHLDIPPSATASQQSVTLSLPSTHYCLHITPTINPRTLQRQSKIFVTIGNSRINPSPVRPEDADQRRPLYDTRLMPGVNRLELEMIAGPPRGAPKIGSGQDVDFEKITLFINLLH
ncbi:hypothetical protein MMC25_004567 [Agyrium rufum]|nr:hypothetical protein [Agyrium rufum]